VKQGRQVFVRRGVSWGQEAGENKGGAEEGQERKRGAEEAWVVGVLCEGDGKGGRRDVIQFMDLAPTGIPTPSTSDPNATGIPESAPGAMLLQTVDAWAVTMPGRAGRIVDDEEEYWADEGTGEGGMKTRQTVTWQGPDGEIWEGRFWSGGVFVWELTRLCI
jgi:hypothetical protein